MRTPELLLKCKVKLGIKSDYALAKELEIPTQRISDYMSGKRVPDAYALVRIAECLKLDPLELIAEYGELSAKRESEKEFWRGFRQRASRRIQAFMLALLCTLSCVTGPQQAAEGGGFRRRRIFA